MVTKYQPISDCAAVLPGFSIKTRVEHEPDGTHQVLMAKHLKDSQPYRYHDDDEIRITPAPSANKYLLKNGDIVFISRGVRNSAHVIEQASVATIASSTLYILRVSPGVNAYYLAWCINQSPLQIAIKKARTGAGTPLVQRGKFAEIIVPLPCLEKQRKIAALAALMNREKNLREELLRQTVIYHKTVGRRLLSKLLQEKDSVKR
ncbi:MAG: restriction endonuclease subunit S [Gammaproteobacteria bacterium]|nr:restriction endonuclease subunit S [Gammaproteobacteria bacterium]